MYVGPFCYYKTLLNKSQVCAAVDPGPRFGQSFGQSAPPDTAVVPTPTGHDGRSKVSG
jgi:hypothetical protein